MPGVTTAYQGPDVHANRPVAGAGAIFYSCTTHGLIYRSDGTTWVTYATLGTAGAYVAGGTDVAVADGGTGASTASGARTNLGLAIGTDIDARVMTTQDDIIVGGSAGAAARLAKGTDGQVLTVDPTTHHILWATPTAGFSDPMTTRGDVIVRNASNATARLAKGSAGTYLGSDGTDVAYAAVTDAQLSTSDITTNNASTSKHGFAPKYPNDATKYLDGTGAYSVPAGAGSSVPYLDQASLDGTYGDDFAASSLDAKWNNRAVYSVLPAQDDGSVLWLDVSGSTAWRTLDEALTQTDEAEAIVHLSVHTPSLSPVIGVFMVNTSGTGMLAGFNLSGSAFATATATTWGYGTQQKTLALANATGYGSLIVGKDYWLSLVKKSGIYFARYSLDGIGWSMPTEGYTPSSFTVGRTGFGLVTNANASCLVKVMRFNVVNRLSVGNNLVITPTSGTTTYTASSQFDGSHTPAKAADANTGTDWATTSTPADDPLYWQVAWSAGQTLNRVRLLGRATDTIGAGHLVFSDGSLVPFPKVPPSGWTYVDFPTKTGMTSMRVVGTTGSSGAPGLAEVEAYLAS